MSVLLTFCAVSLMLLSSCAKEEDSKGWSISLEQTPVGDTVSKGAYDDVYIQAFVKDENGKPVDAALLTTFEKVTFRYSGTSSSRVGTVGNDKVRIYIADGFFPGQKINANTEITIYAEMFFKTDSKGKKVAAQKSFKVVN